MQLLPNADELERSAISTMLMFPKTVGEFLDLLSIDDILSSNIKKAYLGIQALYSSGVEVDLVSLSAELKKEKLKNSASWLSQILNEPVSTNIKNTCEKIKEASIRRRLIEIGNNLMQKAQTDDIDELLRMAGGSLINIDSKTNNSVVVNLSSLTQNALDRYDSLAKQGTVGVLTGLDDLDKDLGGLRPGDLCIIAGRPGLGKSALSTNLILNAAKQEKKSLLFTLEMSIDQVVDRCTSQAARVHLQNVRDGKLSESDYQKIMQFYGRKPIENIMFCERVSDISNIIARARLSKKVDGLDFIVIDYLQLIRGKGKDRYHEVTYISRELKLLATELEIPIVALAQLNRSSESREGRVPSLSDLRDSGSLEQDADSVLLVHRPGQYDAGLDQTVAEIIIAKNRNGRTGRVKVYWDAETTSFLNREWRQYGK